MTISFKYDIDFTPKHGNHFWRVEIKAWLIKNHCPGLEETVNLAGEGIVEADFTLAITSSQMREIRRGLNSSKTWAKLESIFQNFGPATSAPLFRHLIYQDLNVRPEMKVMLRKYLDEVDGGERTKTRNGAEDRSESNLKRLRNLLTNPRRVTLRNRAVAAVVATLQLHGEGKNNWSCNPYLPSDDSSLNAGGRDGKKPGQGKSNGRPGKKTSTNPEAREGTAHDAKGPSTSSASAGGIPYLKTELVSVNRLNSRGYNVIFTRDTALIISNTGEVKFRANRIGPRYCIQELDGMKIKSVPRADLATWHKRLGHIDIQDLYEGCKRHAFRGFRLITSEGTDPTPCGICQMIKMPGMPLRQIPQEDMDILEIVHVDFCGPMPTPSKRGARFFVTFTDNASGWLSVYFLKDCSDILACFKEYSYHAEKMLRRNIRSVQSDDNLGPDFDDYLTDKGIERIKVSYDPQHIRALLETTKCLLMQSGLDDSFWAEAMNTACYIRNRCSLKRLNGLTPHQKWYGKVPSLKHMHEFGARVSCKSYDNVLEESDRKTKKGMFLGYSKKSSGYKIWVPADQKIIISRDVEFEDYKMQKLQNVPIFEESPVEGAAAVERPAADELNSDRKPGEGIPIRKSKKRTKSTGIYAKLPDFGFSRGPPKYEKNLHDYLKNRCVYSDDESSDEDAELEEENLSDKGGLDDDEEDWNILDEGDECDEYTNASLVLRGEIVTERPRVREAPITIKANNCRATPGEAAVHRNEQGAGRIGVTRAISIPINVKRGKGWRQ